MSPIGLPQWVLFVFFGPYFFVVLVRCSFLLFIHSPLHTLHSLFRHTQTTSTASIHPSIVHRHAQTHHHPPTCNFFFATTFHFLPYFFYSPWSDGQRTLFFSTAIPQWYLNTCSPSPMLVIPLMQKGRGTWSGKRNKLAKLTNSVYLLSFLLCPCSMLFQLHCLGLHLVQTRQQTPHGIHCVSSDWNRCHHSTSNSIAITSISCPGSHNHLQSVSSQLDPEDYYVKLERIGTAQPTCKPPRKELNKDNN